MLGRKVLAAVAYVSDASTLPLKKGDVLVCDGSDAAARSGATRRDALETLLNCGVRIWSRGELHAKVVVAGSTAFIGSANWSHRSSATLIEAVIESSDTTVVADALSFITGLTAHASQQVDQHFLRRMPEPEDRPPPREPIPEQARHWLLWGAEAKLTCPPRSGPSVM